MQRLPATPGQSPDSEYREQRQRQRKAEKKRVFVQTANQLGDAGETIIYTITITNTGDVTLTDVEVFDSLLDNLSCVPDPPATLAPGEVIDCTGSLVIQAADLGAGALINVATTTGSGPGGQAVDSSGNTVTLLNAPLAVPALGRIGLLLLALMLALLALPVLRRSID
ncbi:MAG: DUF11 domain-containing protein [Xanthomonadaceae bacterium]|nr:DUF11 domain-containing protein [Xanthomonadaceae bacterium]